MADSSLTLVKRGPDEKRGLLAEISVNVGPFLFCYFPGSQRLTYYCVILSRECHVTLQTVFLLSYLYLLLMLVLVFVFCVGGSKERYRAV